MYSVHLDWYKTMLPTL